MVEDTKDSLTRGSRRTFLKTAGAIGGLSALPNAVTAQETLSHQDVFQGSISIVDLKITHPDADSRINRGSGSGGPRTNYVYNSNLYLIKSPVSKVKNVNSALLRSPEGMLSLDRNRSYKQRELYETFNYDSTVENLHLSPKTRYTPFELEAEIDDENATISQSGDTILNVKSGTQKSTTLGQRKLEVQTTIGSEQTSAAKSNTTQPTVTQSKTENHTVTVSPELTLRNHGKIGIYGVEDGVVVPEDSEEIRSLFAGRSLNTGLIIHDVEDSNVIVIKKDNTEEN